MNKNNNKKVNIHKIIHFLKNKVFGYNFKEKLNTLNLTMPSFSALKNTFKTFSWLSQLGTTTVFMHKSIRLLQICM